MEVVGDVYKGVGGKEAGRITNEEGLYSYHETFPLNIDIKEIIVIHQSMFYVRLVSPL